MDGVWIATQVVTEEFEVALVVWIVGALVAMLLLAQLNLWLKGTWLFRPPRPRQSHFIRADRLRDCPYPATETWGRLFYAMGHRAGQDCPRCTGEVGPGGEARPRGTIRRP